MEKNINIYTPLGIGDLIILRGMLDTKIEEFERINIHLCLSALYSCKPDNIEENVNFLKILTKSIFKDDKYNLYLENNFHHQDIFEIKNKYNLGFKIPNLKNSFCSLEKEIKEDYLVITTKVRSNTGNDSKKDFLKNKEKFCNLVFDLSKKYKIVLLGEKEVEMNPEYQMHGSNKIFSIYNYIINDIGTNLVDKTIPALGITIPTIEKFKEDCAIMSNAKKVITFGSGGNFSIATAVAKTVSYMETSIYENLMREDESNKDVFITTDWETFFSEIEKIGK